MKNIINLSNSITIRGYLNSDDYIDISFCVIASTEQDLDDNIESLFDELRNEYLFYRMKYMERV